MPNYQKESYGDIKDSFIYKWGARPFSLFHRRPSLAISNDGLWIGNWANIIKVGFLRWEWISLIEISQSLGYIYINLYDFEGVYKTIIPFMHRADVQMFTVLSKDDDKVFVINSNYVKGEVQKFIDIIGENNFAEIEIIE